MVSKALGIVNVNQAFASKLEAHMSVNIPLQHKDATAVEKTPLRAHTEVFRTFPFDRAWTSAKFRYASDDGGFAILKVYGADPVNGIVVGAGVGGPAVG